MDRQTYITGSSGFVGTNLTTYLEAKGHTINAISIRDTAWREKLWADAQAVIHLAGKAHDTSNTLGDSEYFKINRDLTLTVFEKFLQSDIEDFFYFSSVKAAADAVDDVLTEDVKPKPLTPYGKSKLEAEDILLNTVLPDGKRLFVIRPCMIHGPGNKGNLNLLFNVVKKGIPWPLAAFYNKRSFISINNLCFLVDKMIHSKKIPSGIYNFADDESLSTNEVVSIISSVLGKSTKLWNISPSLIRSIAKLGGRLSLPLNSERLKKLTESYVVSNQKIKIALGIEKLPLSAKEGMELTIKSFAEKSKK